MWLELLEVHFWFYEHCRAALQAYSAHDFAGLLQDKCLPVRQAAPSKHHLQAPRCPQYNKVIFAPAHLQGVLEEHPGRRDQHGSQG